MTSAGDNFFGDHDHPLGRAHAFDHDAEISPAVSVTFRIGALHMNDSDIRIQRPHRPQRFFSPERRKYLIEKMIAFGGIGS